MKKYLLILALLFITATSYAKSSKGTLEVKTIVQNPLKLEITAYNDEIKLRGLNLIYRGDNVKKIKKVRINYGEEGGRTVFGGYSGKFVFGEFGVRGSAPNIARITFPKGGVELTQRRQNIFKITPIFQKGFLENENDIIEIESVWSNGEEVLINQDDFVPKEDEIGGNIHSLDIKRIDNHTLNLKSIKGVTHLERAIFDVVLPIEEEEIGISFKYKINDKQYTQTKFYTVEQISFFKKGKKYYLPNRQINVPFRLGANIPNGETLSVEIITHPTNFKTNNIRLKYIISDADRGFLDGEYVQGMDKNYLSENKINIVYAPAKEIIINRKDEIDYKNRKPDMRFDRASQKLHYESLMRKRRLLKLMHRW